MIDRKQISRNDYEAVAGDSWPSYDEFQDNIEITNNEILLEIEKFSNNTKDIYKKGYDYLSRAPFYIDKEKLTSDQTHKLMQSTSFCMMPWVHMHAFPDGRVYPCCLAEYWHPMGDLRKNTMREIWNHDKYRAMRRNMLDDKPCVECTKCYEREKHGAFSMRYDANRNYGHHINIVEKTKPDGTYNDFEIKYWDVRFSNLCNFRCRSCGPIFSSSWYNDHVKLYNRIPDSLGREINRIEYTAGDEESMIRQMEEHVPYLEQVYFAGGEPLIMKEHYYLLEKLIEAGKTDVRLQYNTNFSELRFKDKHVFDYWKHFKNVSVGASLDGMHKQGELIRKGQDWQQTVANRELMIQEVPHVDFYVGSTVSSMNVLHILKFHREWADLGLIQPKDWNINNCQSPAWYRVDIFPEDFKQRVIYPAYEEHIAWLDPQDSLRRATNGYQSLLSMMKSNDASQLWSQFVSECNKLDVIRGENFWHTFPEFESLR